MVNKKHLLTYCQQCRVEIPMSIKGQCMISFDNNSNVIDTAQTVKTRKISEMGNNYLDIHQNYIQFPYFSINNYHK